MSPLRQSNSNEYAEFGFEPEEIESASSQFSAPQEQEDYSQYGFEAENTPKKEKAGKLSSIGYGILEGLVGIPALVQSGVNAWTRGVANVAGIDASELDLQNPAAEFLQTFPESEDQTARRLRVGTSAVSAGALGGIPGIIAGLVGSQAGQTVREVYGNEGKFDEFGWGEAGALAADLLAGSATGIASSAARSGGRVVTSQAPTAFQKGNNPIQRAAIKNAIQKDKNILQGIIDNFSSEQISDFRQKASQISPDRYTELSQSSAAGIKKQAENMFRKTQLDTISPLSVTPEQGGSAIQSAANEIFQKNVITAEREAYSAARSAAEGLSGQAPKTIEQAKNLRSDILKNNPTPEQQSTLRFLDNLINDLETQNAGKIIPASKILDANGNPVVPAQEIAASTAPSTRSGNDLVDLVQRGNSAVNYDSELRMQSHRLKPIINTLREETGQVLAQNPNAASLYRAANSLHAQNSETWGTKYMKNVRFAENPEKIIGATKSASNMRNLKKAIPDPAIQGIAERMVVDSITSSGSSESNAKLLRNLSPELSAHARSAGQQLSSIKDPLTSPGGRIAIRNDILKDAAGSVSTGRRPEKILGLMETPKGYALVAEALNGTPQSRKLFDSFQRLFVEDVFNSSLDKNGSIDFKKAQNIFKNQDVKSVVKQIGGDELVSRFSKLETYARNLENNLSLYKSPETISAFQKIAKETKQSGTIGLILHSLHVPLEVIAGLGLGKVALSGSKAATSAAVGKILSNPKAVSILENLSNASTPQEISRYLPRLIAELEKQPSGAKDK